MRSKLKTKLETAKPSTEVMNPPEPSYEYDRETYYNKPNEKIIKELDALAPVLHATNDHIMNGNAAYNALYEIANDEKILEAAAETMNISNVHFTRAALTEMFRARALQMIDACCQSIRMQMGIYDITGNITGMFYMIKTRMPELFDIRFYFGLDDGVRDTIAARYTLMSYSNAIAAYYGNIIYQAKVMGLKTENTPVEERDNCQYYLRPIIKFDWDEINELVLNISHTFLHVLDALYQESESYIDPGFPNANFN